MSKKEENNNTKFDFGTKAQETTIESVKSNKLTATKVEETSADASELIDNTSKATEDNKETTKKTKSGKAIVSYIGNGVWRDSDGKCWSRNEKADANILSIRSYDKSEYEGREDLKFMVKYGEMKVSLV